MMSSTAAAAQVPEQLKQTSNQQQSTAPASDGCCSAVSHLTCAAANLLQPIRRSGVGSFLLTWKQDVNISVLK